ncbi:hypothetical protein HG530_014869 [Fusarium avenaceum]|nr:hypothetical protein HG530_014869 [Fusarium avenaceum]
MALGLMIEFRGRRVVLDYGSKKTGSKPASEKDDYYPVFRLDFVSVVGLPRRPICRSSHFFNNIKDIFLRGELLGEGVEPRWTLWGKETQMIAFDKWVIFQTLFMDGWTGFLERLSAQGDTFWTDHQPAFHAYDYGANINIEVNQGIANLEEETVVRPVYSSEPSDESDESDDEYSNLQTTQQGWDDHDGEMHRRYDVGTEDDGGLFVSNGPDNIPLRSPSNLSPGDTDMDHRGREDEVDVDGHNNDDDNDGDDERERRFHEWMNESEDISMSQPTGTRLQDLGNEDNGQTDSHQRSANTGRLIIQ